MTQIKRMAFLLIAAAFLLLTPLSALAARQQYVPTEAVYEYYNAGTWKEVSRESYKYTKNGRITSYTKQNVSDSSVYKLTYKWKGNYLKREESPYTIYTYSYKKKKLKSTTEVDKSTNYKTTVPVSWKKRNGTVGVGQIAGIITVNKRNRIIKQTHYSYFDEFRAESTKTIKYFSNGNIRSISNHGLSDSSEITFNKKGYPISYKSSLHWEQTCTYKKDKKGRITEQLITTTRDGEVSYNRRRYTKWRKISRVVRNCDAFGNELETPYSLY